MRPKTVNPNDNTAIMVCMTICLVPSSLMGGSLLCNGQNPFGQFCPSLPHENLYRGVCHYLVQVPLNVPPLWPDGLRGAQAGLANQRSPPWADGPGE
jgi:hypothetical protein